MTHETRYSDGFGRDHEALHLPWHYVEDVLGEPHSGDPEQDRALVAHLRARGAPEWVTDAEGWVDEKGWGLIGPPLPTLWEAAEYPECDPRSLVGARYDDLGVVLLNDGVTTWAADADELDAEGAATWPGYEDVNAYTELCQRVDPLDPESERVREACARHGLDPARLEY